MFPQNTSDNVFFLNTLSEYQQLTGISAIEKFKFILDFFFPQKKCT